MSLVAHNRLVVGPVKLSDCHREECILSHGNPLKCLMESVRHRWEDQSALNYCIDHSARRFVDKLHNYRLSGANTSMVLPKKHI
jgi:hypothetical protein